MSDAGKVLKTPRGKVPFPAYIPVTTFGGRYPLDDLIRPYLPRLAPAVMVSAYYARQMRKAERPRLPLLVDSGGFVSLRKGARVLEGDGVAWIELDRDGETERVDPQSVLSLQETLADVAFTLDFPIPPGADLAEAERRQRLTVQNALWARRALRRADLPLFASVQAWDPTSARQCAEALVDEGFDGLAVGGLVPRVRDWTTVLGIVDAVREVAGTLPVHVFGLGRPEGLADLYTAGADSVDSSSFVQTAATGTSWSGAKLRAPSTPELLGLALGNLLEATARTAEFSGRAPPPVLHGRVT